MEGPVSHRMTSEGTWRELYRSTLSPECFLEATYLECLLGNCASMPVASLSQQIEQWQATQTKAYAAAAAEACKHGNGRAFAQAMAIYSAPVASVSGCWLQGMSAPGVFEDPAQLRLMQLFAHDVGVGYPNASRADQFNALLGQLQLTAFAWHLRNWPHCQAFATTPLNCPQC